MLLLSASDDGACEAATPPGAKVVGATVYGGPGSPSPDSVGAGGELNNTRSFAELSRNWSDGAAWDFSALGDLPMGTRLRITVDGRSTVAVKRDVGRGGPPVGSPPTPRAIDLWWQTARALGLPVNWSGRASISTLTGSESAVDCSTAGSSGLGAAIVRIARREVGVREPLAWSRFGPDPWCALFVTWVWRHAGVEIGSIAFTGAIHAWATAGHGTVIPATGKPEPGDAILYGTGPADPSTSVHVGLVEQVFSNSEITTIEGNTAGGDRVARIGPFAPGRAQNAPAYRPGPVYAFIRPKASR